VQAILPSTAKKESDIKGNIVLDAPYFPEPVKSTLTLDITKGAEYGVSLSLSQTSPIKVEWNDTLGKYEKKRVDLRVKNTGQLDLQYFVFSIDNENTCSNEWLIFVENNLDSVKSGETKSLTMEFSAPIIVRGSERSEFCDIRYEFDDPTGSGQISRTETSFVEVEPQA